MKKRPGDGGDDGGGTRPPPEHRPTDGGGSGSGTEPGGRAGGNAGASGGGNSIGIASSGNIGGTSGSGVGISSSGNIGGAGGGSGVVNRPLVFVAADGSPVNVAFDNNGQFASAQATGKDGIARSYRVDSNRVQHYIVGTLPELMVSVGYNIRKGLVRLTSEAGDTRLVYEVACVNADEAGDAASADFQITATRYYNGAAGIPETRTTAGSAVAADFATTFGNIFGTDYQNGVQFFQPVLGKLSSPSPTPEDRSSAGASSGAWAHWRAHGSLELQVLSSWAGPS